MKAFLGTGHLQHSTRVGTMNLTRFRRPAPSTPTPRLFLIHGWVGLALLWILSGSTVLNAQSTEPRPAYPGGTVSDRPAAYPVTSANIVPTAQPQPVPPPAAAAQRSEAELETLAAPIALYPDPLIALILPASVYPVEVVMAARFVKDTNNLAKLDQQPWDEKVREVARFPEVIAKMDADLAWTTALGQAFVEQPLDLMNAIQGLRRKAQAAGTLQSNPQQVVVVTNSVVERLYENQVVYVTNTVIEVQPAQAQVIYVPTYNPSVVYVDTVYDPGATAFVSFGVGMFVGAALWGNCDWHYGGCYWGYYPPPPPPLPPPYRPPPGSRPPPPGGRPPGEIPPGTRPPAPRPRPGPTVGEPSTPGATRPATGAMNPRWQPDPARLAAAGSPSAATRQARGRPDPSSSASFNSLTGRPGPGVPGSTLGGSTASTRPYPGSIPARPGVSSSAGYNRPGPSPTPSPSPSSGINRPAPSATPGNSRPSMTPTPSPRPSTSSAFSGVNSGSSVRGYSDRGATSRGSSASPSPSLSPSPRPGPSSRGPGSSAPSSPTSGRGTSGRP